MKRPNVLFIYPDQMRYDSMGNAGNTVAKTPAFDRLAAQSINFRQAYTSYPLCCPFRASIMTGKYATSHGMMANHYPINLNQSFLPQIMREEGYSTGWFGKWHLNGGKKFEYVPEEYRLGFESFVGFSRGHNYLKPIYYRNNDTNPYKSDMYEPDLQTCHLIEFMRGSLSEGKPFFAGIGYGVPHPPVDYAPDYYKNLYSPEEITPKENTPPNLHDKAKEFLAKYYGLVANTDYQLGRIINALEYLGIYDNTLIVLASDHGEMAFEHGRDGKKTFHEASMHVPFFIRCPGEAPKEISEQLVDPSVDIMPTILDICGIKIPDEVEGQSLYRLIREGADSTLEPFVFYQIPKEAEGPERFPVPHRGIRTADSLYVEVDGIPSYLFDLKKDPDEIHNKIEDKAYSTQITDLQKMLNGKMEEIGDSWNKEIIFPPPDFQTHEEGHLYVEEVYKNAVYEEVEF